MDNRLWTMDGRQLTIDNNVTIKKNTVLGEEDRGGDGNGGLGDFEATRVDAMGRMTTTRGGRGQSLRRWRDIDGR
jgi:hypothetical protein